MERWEAHPATQQVKVALRPPAVADPPAIFVADSLTEDERYELWHERRGPTADVVAAIAGEAAIGTYQPTISLLMPVCDTEPWMLVAAAESVLGQAYPNWQLCMADDASRRPETLATLESLARRDSRITTTRLSKRSGISAATNAALSLATGDYVAFLDHDDVLKPHALGQVARWLDADPSLDMVYSDEDKLDPAGRLTEARWKPDWSPNLLLCQNYVCHLLVVRRALIEKLGGLRSDFDGSQDYDLVLRVADVTDRVAHIPDSLYSWRQHPRSAAAAGDHKPWAWMAAQRALGDWLRRREDRGGTGGWTEEGAWEDVHRVRFKRLGEPKVSIIIPTAQWPSPTGAVHREPRFPHRLRQFRGCSSRQPERRPRHARVPGRSPGARAALPPRVQLPPAAQHGRGRRRVRRPRVPQQRHRGDHLGLAGPADRAGHET